MSRPINLPLTQVLRDRRRSQGLSQQEVARSLGVSQQTIANWEGGTATPSPRRWRALERSLVLADDTIRHLVDGLSRVEDHAAERKPTNRSDDYSANLVAENERLRSENAQLAAKARDWKFLYESERAKLAITHDQLTVLTGPESLAEVQAPFVPNDEESS